MSVILFIYVVFGFTFLRDIPFVRIDFWDYIQIM